MPNRWVNITQEERFWAKVQKTDSCWLWIGKSKAAFGYGAIYFNGKSQHTHRVSWEIAFGAIPDKLWVLHKCDNPPCVNPKHLFLGTAQDNNRDMFSKGRGRRYDGRGELNPNAKLTYQDVAKIKLIYAEGNLSQAAIAKQFGVTQSMISKITLAQFWKT